MHAGGWDVGDDSVLAAGAGAAVRRARGAAAPGRRSRRCCRPAGPQDQLRALIVTPGQSVPHRHPLHRPPQRVASLAAFELDDIRLSRAGETLVAIDRVDGQLQHPRTRQRWHLHPHASRSIDPASLPRGSLMGGGTWRRWSAAIPQRNRNAGPRRPIRIELDRHPRRLGHHPRSADIRRRARTDRVQHLEHDPVVCVRAGHLDARLRARVVRRRQIPTSRCSELTGIVANGDAGWLFDTLHVRHAAQRVHASTAASIAGRLRRRWT